MTVLSHTEESVPAAFRRHGRYFRNKSPSVYHPIDLGSTRSNDANAQSNQKQDIPPSPNEQESPQRILGGQSGEGYIVASSSRYGSRPSQSKRRTGPLELSTLQTAKRIHGYGCPHSLRISSILEELRAKALQQIQHQGPGINTSEFGPRIPTRQIQTNKDFTNGS